MFINNLQKWFDGFFVERIIAIQSFSLEIYKLATDEPFEIVGNSTLFVG